MPIKVEDIPNIDANQADPESRDPGSLFKVLLRIFIKWQLLIHCFRNIACWPKASLVLSVG
jgi:hypothetical protein